MGWRNNLGCQKYFWMVSSDAVAEFPGGFLFLLGAGTEPGHGPTAWQRRGWENEHVAFQATKVLTRAHAREGASTHGRGFFLSLLSDCMLPEWIQLEKVLSSPTRRPEETNKKENDFLLFLAQPQLQGAL